MQWLGSRCDITLHCRFSLHSGGKDNFVIDAVSGQISVAGDAVLGIEQNGELYELEVRLRMEFCKTRLSILIVVRFA